MKLEKGKQYTIEDSCGMTERQGTYLGRFLNKSRHKNMLLFDYGEDYKYTRYVGAQFTLVENGSECNIVLRAFYHGDTPEKLYLFNERNEDVWEPTDSHWLY